MQRISSTTLTIILTIFVAAFGIALIVATYVMATYLVRGFRLDSWLLQ